MNEMTLTYKFIAGLVGLVLASFFYAWGGRSGKWKRRFVGSFILALTVNILFIAMGKWIAWYLLIYPLLAIGFSMGYGGTDNVGKKIIRRSVYALVVLTSGAFCAYFVGGGAWIMLAVHVGVGMFSVLLGTRNVLPASVEEPLICMVLNLGLICYPFINI